MEHIIFSLGETVLLHRTKGMLTLTNKQINIKANQSQSQINTSVKFWFRLTLLINGGES